MIDNCVRSSLYTPEIAVQFSTLTTEIDDETSGDDAQVMFVQVSFASSEAFMFFDHYSSFPGLQLGSFPGLQLGSFMVTTC